MRVYIGCFGSGLGHGTRMLEVGDLLRSRGAVVEFSSSGEVARYIASRGFRCNVLPLADVRYSASGALSMRATLAASPALLAKTYSQVRSEIANLKRFGPDVVLSDSALGTLLAAKALGIDVYVVINQLRLSAPPGPSGLGSSLLSEGTSSAMAKFWGLSDGILLPDLPPPYTISESSLWNGKVKRKEYVGFLTNTDSPVGDEATADFVGDSRTRVFWQISGPSATRTPFVKKAREIISQLSREYAFVLTEGDPAGSRRPQRIGGGWRYDWCDSTQAYFAGCDVVVSRAGHGTLARAIINSKVSLLVPIPRQTEQEGNAAKARRLGVAEVLGQDELAADSFRRALDSLATERCQSRARELGRIARDLDARKKIVELIESSA